ncbi:unnamed protein product [Ostreobium quekettii]|uniref:Uncharacterized protein n=1 Tax=Ostreobium quekettii TaxID=121088 RepID=A0A8S1J0R5_9CHLO|nr:unnamed protein product [Ostreobium quekettii]|eukprot:evm.model.scf_3007.2 EVM.evm.TU.scf_3007.2   scf_3007:8681-9178(-)
MKHGVSAYLCGHLHQEFSSQLYRVHDAPDKKFLAELEAGGWKFARRFRVVAADNGAPSFADLRYKPTLDSGQGFRIEALSGSIGRDHHVVVITSPSSAHFSPLGSGAPVSAPVEVHALVLPMDVPRWGNDYDNVDVVARWTCSGGVFSKHSKNGQGKCQNAIVLS